MTETTYGYHRRPKDFLKFHCLDFNEYQGEIAPSTVETIRNPELMRYYPPVEDSLLPLAISRFLKIPVENIALTAGADSALFHTLLTEKIKQRRQSVRPFFNPTYDHAIHFMKILEFPVLSAPSEKQIIYLSFPNNPTGEEISPKKLEKEISARKDSLWILDMTYMCYSRYRIEDYGEVILSHKNSVAVFSFAKSFPLAGLRMACVFGAPSPVMTYFKRDYNKKSVGTLARAVALNCLQNRSFYLEQQNQIKTNKKPLMALFLKTARKQGFQLKAGEGGEATDGGEAGEGGGNFFLISGAAADRVSFARFLYSKKIIVRQKPSWDFLRVTSVCNSFFEKIEKSLSSSKT